MNRLPRAVWVAVGVACVLSLGYSFYYHDRPRVDAKAYDAIAWNLASGNGYVEHQSNADTPVLDDAVVRVGPGYQFFLAGIYSLVGHKVWAVWIVQAILRALTVLLIALIAFRVWPDKERTATIAAWIFAVSPDLTVVSGLLLTETFFLFLFVGAVFASLRAFDGSARDVALASAIWGLAVLTRPTALFGVLVFMGFLTFRKQYARAFLPLLGLLLVVGPWSYVMSDRYDAFILTTTAGGYDLWVGNNPEATGGFVKTPEMQALREVTHSVELDRRGKEEYFKYLFNQPIDFIGLQLQKTAQYFSLARPTGFWVHLIAYPVDRFLTAGLSFVWTAIVMIGGVSALVALLRNGVTFSGAFLVGVALVQPLAVIPIIVETRYRYALYPFLALFFGYGASEGSVRKRVLIWVSVIFIIVAVIDVSIHFRDLFGKLMQLLSIF